MSARTLLLRRRRLLLAALALVLLYRRRRALLAWLLRQSRAVRSLSRAAAAAATVADVAAVAAADLRAYLAAPRAGPAPPRSLRRLLRIAAAPDAAAVLRAVAAGAARGLVAGQSAPATLFLSSHATDSTTRAAAPAAPAAAAAAPTVLLAGAMAVLDTPAGSRVAGGLVATAVREAVRALREEQHGGGDKADENRDEKNRSHLTDINSARRNPSLLPPAAASSSSASAHRMMPPQIHKQQQHWVEALLAAIASDRGRTLVVDVASAITRTAVPLVMAHHGGGSGYGASPAHDDDDDDDTAPLSNQRKQPVPAARMSAAATPDVLVTPQNCRQKDQPLQTQLGTPELPGNASCAFSPHRSNRRFSSPASTTNAASPAQKQLLLTLLAMRGQHTWIDRLAVLLSRERALVRDIVRTVASEGIRSYLTTQAELRMATDFTAAAPSPSPSPSPLRPPSSPSPSPSPLGKPSGPPNAQLPIPASTALLRSAAVARGLAAVASASSRTAAPDTSLAGPQSTRQKQRLRAAVQQPTGLQRAPRALTEGPLEALWHLVIRSVAHDVRLAVSTYWNAPPSPVWLFL